MKTIKLVLKATLFCLAAALSMAIAQAGTGTTNLLNNWSFEMPGTVKITTGFDTIPFWFSHATAADSGVESGEVPPDSSTWCSYTKSQDAFCPANQTTTHIIQQGECFVVSIWSKNEWVTTDSYAHTNAYLTVALYYGGTPDTVVDSTNATLGTVGTLFFTNTFVIVPAPSPQDHLRQADWTNYVCGVITNVIPTNAFNQVLGIQIWQSSTQYNTAISESHGSWLEMDDVQVHATNGISPIPTPVTLSPTNIVFGGNTLTFTENAFGSTTLAYQWQTDGGGGGALTNIPPGAGGVTGSDTNIMTVATSTTAGTYKFDVVIANNYGSVTTAVVSVTVRGLIAPIITQDTGTADFGPFTNIFAFNGGNVNLYAAFDGAPVVTNQWMFNNGTGYAAIAGATNFGWTLTNIQSGSVGYYRLGATNATGSSNSTPAHLTNLADPGAPANVGTNMYSYCVYTNNPWAYWKFEEKQNTLTNSMQAYDYSGHNFDATYGNSDGTAGSGCLDGGENISVNGQYGPLPNAYLNAYPGFPLTNGCAGLSYNNNNGYLRVPPLNLNTNTVTFTMWIYPNDAAPVIAANTGLMMNRNGSDAAGVGFSASQNANLTSALGYTWNSNSAATYGWNSHLFPPAQTWSFVAYVISPQNTTIYLYYVGSGATNLYKAVNNVTNAPESFSGGTTWIGGDNWNNGQTFNGSIDEVAVFPNAMSEVQVQSLFLRALGLTNGVAPSFTLLPASTQVYRGQVLQIPSLAGGIPSPYYLWQFQLPNGTWNNAANSTVTGIFGATNATFGWTNYSGAYTNFRCIAYNAFGTNTSPAVSALVLPVPTNGQWTVNFCVTSTNNGGTGLPYVGHGVLVGPSGAVPGTYWNALSGSQLTSSTSYRDNGSTVSGIRFGSTGYPGNYSSLTSLTTNNALLDTFAQITPTNVFVFNNVPNGRYNLALYGCVGSYVDRGITFIVNGVSQSVTNVQDVSFLPDNMVIYTNVLVSNGSLEVDMTCVTNTVLHSPSTEGDFNGAQLQLVKYGPDILSMTNSGANFILTYVGGQLLESTNIAVGWKTNLTATSPYTINPTGQMKFYRISTTNY